MLVKTLLNKIEHFKSFIFSTAKIEEINCSEAVVVEIKALVNSKPECPICHKCYKAYDTREARIFEYVPIWSFKVFFWYEPLRVNCPTHKVKVEYMPWVSGKEQMTTSYKIYLSRWAKRLSWKETAEIFKTSWDSVYRAVESIVEYGLANRKLADVTELGVDEIQVFKGNKYLTMVYQLNAGDRKLIWCGMERKTKTLLQFFHEFGIECSKNLKYVCSDMWRPYLNVIKKKAPNAITILDRFQIMKKFNEAIDHIRRDEVKAFKAEKQDNVLVNSRWLLLKRTENLNDDQTISLNKLLKLNLSSIKGYLMGEDFQQFWEYEDPAVAEKFL